MLRSVLKFNTSRSAVFAASRFQSARPQPDQTSVAFGAAADPEWDNALPYSKIPRPKIWRMMKEFAPGGRYHNVSVPDLYQRFREDYGDLLMFPGVFGRKNLLVCFNPDDFQKIILTEGVWPTRRAMETFVYFREHVRPDIFKGQGGLVTVQGESWHKFRTIVNPVMLQPKTVRLYVDKLDEISRQFTDVISKLRTENNELPANFNEWMNRWALESIGVLALDTRLGVLEPNLTNDSVKIVKLVREFFILTYQLDVEPSIWMYYKTPKFNRLMKTLDDLTGVVMSRIDEAVQRMEKNPSQASDSQSVLEKLLKVDRHVAIVMACDMLMAGVDTTASASSGILYCLAKNPDKQARLREELRTILPTKDSPITSEKLHNLPYLRACIKEGLRLYPPTAINVRATGRDLVLQGYQVPKDTDIAMAGMMLHQEDQFFARGKEFLPERWLKHEECPSGKDAHPFVYLPFGFGARTCIGKRLALLEIELLIARITRQFEYRWNHEDLKFLVSMVNVPMNELKFEMIDVKD